MKPNLFTPSLPGHRAIHDKWKQEGKRSCGSSPGEYQVEKQAQEERATVEIKSKTYF